MTNIQVYDDTAERLEKLSDRCEATIAEIIDALLDEAEEDIVPWFVNEEKNESLSRKRKKLKEDTNNGTTVSFDLNTGVVETIDANQYGSAIEFPDDADWEEDGATEKWDDHIVECAIPYIEELIHLTDNSIKISNFSYSHPRDYNYSADEINFTLTLSADLLNRLISEYTSNRDFIDFISKHYRSYDGFISYMASDKQELLKQNEEVPWRTLAQILSYNAKDERKKAQEDFEMDVWESEYDVDLHWFEDDELTEGTKKTKSGKWINKGKSGKDHGKFSTKKKADEQRKAMFARGWKPKGVKEGLTEDIDFTSFKKELKDTIPEKDIDTYRSDLYVRITPETTALIKKYGIDKSTMLSKFRDNIDHDMWYELPFVNMSEFIGKEKEEVKRDVDRIKSFSKKEELSEEMNKDTQKEFKRLDKIAKKLYKENNNGGFSDFTDDELAILWSRCMLSKEYPYGCAYDDEVYDAIIARDYDYDEKQAINNLRDAYARGMIAGFELDKYEDIYKKRMNIKKNSVGSRKIFDKADEIYNAEFTPFDFSHKEESLKESRSMRDYAKEDEDREKFADWLYNTNRYQTAWDFYFADEEGNDAEEILNTMIEDYLDKSFVKDEISEEEEEYWKRIARLTINEIAYYNFNKDEENESLNEALDEDERRTALAKYLNAPIDTIKQGYRDEVFETEDGEEYFVVDEDEARQLAIEDVENFIEESGITGFTKYFQEWIFDNAIKKDWFEYALDESNDSYIYDITLEEASDDRYPSRLVEEAVEAGLISEEEGENFDMNSDEKYDLQDKYKTYLNDQVDDPIQWYKDNFGDREFNETVIENGLTDDYAIAEEAVDEDGIAHFLASYDGKEIELDNGLFAYRLN